ncbi:MAG: hypothetical protein RBU37_00785 [Myxococcota bacterium]|jgi:hypothetical protein|nr:hypothetical protein [Myxococcota bacterium]
MSQALLLLATQLETLVGPKALLLLLLVFLLIALKTLLSWSPSSTRSQDLLVPVPAKPDAKRERPQPPSGLD